MSRMMTILGIFLLLGSLTISTEAFAKSKTAEAPMNIKRFKAANGQSWSVAIDNERCKSRQGRQALKAESRIIEFAADGVTPIKKVLECEYGEGVFTKGQAAPASGAAGQSGANSFMGCPWGCQIVEKGPKAGWCWCPDA